MTVCFLSCMPQNCQWEHEAQGWNSFPKLTVLGNEISNTNHPQHYQSSTLSFTINAFILRELRIPLQAQKWKVWHTRQGMLVLMWHNVHSGPQECGPRAFVQHCLWPLDILFRFFAFLCTSFVPLWLLIHTHRVEAGGGSRTWPAMTSQSIFPSLTSCTSFI